MLILTRGNVLALAPIALWWSCSGGGRGEAAGTLQGDKNPPPAQPVEVNPTRIDPRSEHSPQARSPMLDYLAEENRRWMKTVNDKSESTAYYLAYRVLDQRNISIAGEAGAIVADEDNRQRLLNVEIRVGSPELDNYRPLLDPERAELTSYERVSLMPGDTEPKAIKHHLWLQTDRRYREALLMLGLVKTQEQIASQKEIPPDFSHEPPVAFIQSQRPLVVDQNQWRNKIRSCSKTVRRKAATRGSCGVDFESNTWYFVNSEGSQIQQSWTTARFSVTVGVKAKDGQPLSRVEQRFARTPDELPSAADVETMVQTINRDLAELHEAPAVKDTYFGPAILEGRAAAVFFHEVFGHRIEGHRQKDKDFGQTFTSKVGSKIMPEWLSVIDDPTISTLNGEIVSGFYRFDDEGVQARPTQLVENGVLKGFIMGRTPIEGFGNSNGHGRAQTGLTAVSRQGNLVVQSDRSVDKKTLFAQLLDEIKRQDKPYGLVFTDISGGFTNTSRYGAQAFKVEPIMAYRVYPDGRRQLVRGIDIAGLPLTALGNILSAGRPLETFNGMCGAESGWVPVSASAPSLLLKTLEVERGFEGSDSNPVLAPPSLQHKGQP